MVYFLHRIVLGYFLPKGVIKKVHFLLSSSDLVIMSVLLILKIPKERPIYFVTLCSGYRHLNYLSSCILHIIICYTGLYYKIESYSLENLNAIIWMKNSEWDSVVGERREKSYMH
jgi:hypothetical protein